MTTETFPGGKSIHSPLAVAEELKGLCDVKELLGQILGGDKEGIELITCQEIVHNTRRELEALILSDLGANAGAEMGVFYDAYAFCLAAERIFDQNEGLILDAPSTVASRVMREGRKTLKPMFAAPGEKKKR